MTDLLKQPVVAVVDDDERVLESLGSLLESADYSVRLFESAAAMLEASCLADIACLISDIDMPGMDGLELLRIARAARPDIPVILITGQSSKLNQLPAAELDSCQLVRKPFNSEDLLRRIEDSIMGQALPRRAP